jgi:glycosyltransferase involved in cell wall biosynthesis
MRIVSIPKYIRTYLSGEFHTEDTFSSVNKAYNNLLKGKQPDVSVVIPAYNEEDSIVQTLASICNNITSLSVEVIVVNNNSKDDTEKLVKACGVTCITEMKQGVTNARNAGLAHAKSKYILNADADSVYPKYWIEELITPLIKNEDIAITYGRFSFIPIGKTGRVTYFFYENVVDIIRAYNKRFKTEAINVGGCSSGFRREQCLQVDGFNHPPGSNEDGYLALKLNEKGFGKIHKVSSGKSIVWTTDRRIQIDGGFFKAIIKRLKRLLS